MLWLKVGRKASQVRIHKPGQERRVSDPKVRARKVGT